MTVLMDPVRIVTSRTAVRPAAPLDRSGDPLSKPSPSERHVRDRIAERLRTDGRRHDRVPRRRSPHVHGAIAHRRARPGAAAGHQAGAWPPAGDADMSGGRHRGYTLRTSRGTGSYRSWERAVGAARWTAEVTKADTSIVNAPERRQRRDVGREARRSGCGPLDLGTATGRGFRTRPSRVTFPCAPGPLVSDARLRHDRPGGDYRRPPPFPRQAGFLFAERGPGCPDPRLMRLWASALTPCGRTPPRRGRLLTSQRWRTPWSARAPRSTRRSAGRTG
jgi:hypothetical protein